MKTNYKYIHFMLLSETQKTSTYACCNNRSNGELGQVKWYSPWRQYCFFPEMNTVFNNSCLEDIKHFISQLMNQRRERSIPHANQNP